MHNYLQFFNLQSDLNIYLRSYIKSKHVSFQNLNSWCETCNTTKICRRGVFFFFQLSSSFRSLLSMVQNYSSTLFFFFAISALYLSLRHVATVLEAPHPKNIFEVWLCSVLCCAVLQIMNSLQFAKEEKKTWENVRIEQKSEEIWEKEENIFHRSHFSQFGCPILPIAFAGAQTLFKIIFK